MKVSRFIVLFAATGSWLLGGPKEDAKTDATAKTEARTTAATLFKTATPAEAVAYVQSKRPAEAIADGRLASTVQGLADTAATLYNQRELRAARAAVAQALSAAQPLLSGQTAMPAARRAQLCSTLGFLCENILRDPKTAAELYTLATQVNPADQQAARQRDELVAQEKARGRK